MALLAVLFASMVVEEACSNFRVWLSGVSQVVPLTRAQLFVLALVLALERPDYWIEFLLFSALVEADFLGQ